jgi:hypothetical protein
VQKLEIYKGAYICVVLPKRITVISAERPAMVARCLSAAGESRAARSAVLK